MINNLAPFAILGWGFLLAFYIRWRIGHERQMAALRAQLALLEEQGWRG